MVSRRHFLSALLVAGVAAPLAGMAAIGEAQAQQRPDQWHNGRPGGNRPPPPHQPNRAPPRPRQERRPPPRPGYVWVPGFWEWNPRRRDYVWRSGQWVRNRPGFRHRDPRWVRSHNGWTFDPGGWHR
ncbi:twin-arginine translocation signal domain-containing protein [Pseudochelatococcus lubricantis]|nr:twin-arginine translocation signal domain-containing protein [Pseudochelatococcus lubricantis]